MNKLTQKAYLSEAYLSEGLAARRGGRQHAQGPRRLGSRRRAYAAKEPALPAEGAVGYGSASLQSSSDQDTVGRRVMAGDIL